MSHTPEHFTVWMEIPVSDLAAGTRFYETVFDTRLNRDESGPQPIMMFPTKGPEGIAGHLYEGNPASDGTGPTIHLACPDGLEETTERVMQAGGTVLTPPITIPPGRFAYCQDPDGNAISVFEFNTA